MTRVIRLGLAVMSAIGVSVWTAVTIAGQATDAGALSASLRAHVQNERFEVVTSVRGLPLGVRDALQMLFGSTTLDIAESGAEFQAGAAAANSKLPIRRMVAAGCAKDHHCLVYYERGGTERTWHIALFHWTPAATRFEGGGTAPAGLTTIDDVRRAMLAGWAKARFW